MKRVLLAGIVGTAVMTMLMLAAPLIGVFFVAQMVVRPMMGGGVFSDGNMLMIGGSLMGHLVYGGILGAIYGAPVTRQPVQGLGLRSRAAR